MPTGADGHSTIAVCQQETRRLPRQPDGEAFYQIYSGGMRAAKSREDAWYIEPVFDNRHPCAKGFMPTAAMQAFFTQHGLTFIAFHRSGWLRGNYYSIWSPFNLGQTNHLLGPADVWGNIAGNHLRARAAGNLAATQQPTHEQVATLLDSRSEVERLSRSISLSLRNMDISVEQIAEFYHEQLVNHMASGNLEGQRSSSTLDQTLFAHVHSFFMHLGAARDYLAALSALRIGKDPQKVDSFARLTEAVRPEHFPADNFIQLFNARGYLQQKPTSSVKFDMAGWMDEVTDLRNEFMHRRPYGDRFIEHMGFVQPIDRQGGLYRYVRPILLTTGEDDVQSVILRHYREMTSLCHAAAQISGYDASMFTLTDADIVSAEFDEGRD